MTTATANLLRATAPFRPEPRFHVYPPYHRGPYLEAYFYQYTQRHPLPGKRQYLPIFWTHCYNNRGFRIHALQRFLNTLDPNGAYFTVCLHADAPREKLPANTLVFSAGGNRGNHPLPLVCSPVPAQKPVKRDVLCSFTGSATHPVRTELQQLFGNQPGYDIRVRPWKARVPRQEQSTFLELANRSVFSLCPRGYGKTSYRLYEVLQLGSIPVYVYDQPWLPYEKLVDWKQLAVLVPTTKVKDLDRILRSYRPDRIEAMRQRLREAYPRHFSLEAVCRYIYSQLQHA
ncbi:MAG: exostosin family protein [Bacteroidota bacterium]